jgi:hypothetical protein
MVIKPAAGPETPNFEPLKKPTTTPPTTPAMMPENNIGFAPVEASATPKHNGSATKKTTKLEGRSFRQWLKKFFMYKILIFPYFGET